MKSFKNFINNFRQGSDQDHLEADQHTDTGTFAQGFSGCAVSSQPAAQYLFAQLAAATTAPRALGAGPDPEEWLPRVGQTTTHGFFAVPSSMAYDSLHRVLAIGNQHGQIHLFQGVLPEEAPVFVSSMAEPVRPVSPSMPDTGATAGRPGARPSAAAFYARQAGLADGGSPGSATPPRRPARRAVAPRVSTINLNGRQGVRLLAFTSSELSSHAVTQAQRPGAPRLEYEDGLGGLLVVDQDSNLYLYQREYLTLIQSIKAASFLNPGDSVTFIYPMPRSPLVFIGLNSGGVVVFTVYPTLVQAHFTLPTPFREEVDSPRRSAHSAPFAVVAISMNPADANQLLVAHRNNHAIVWELDKRQPRRAFALPLHATPKASSSGGPAATTTTTTATPVDLFSELRAAVWQPIAGRWLATGHACGLICVFDFHAAAPAVAAAAGSDPQRVVLPPVESPHVIINAMGTPQSSLGQRRQPISSIRWCSVPSLPDLSSPEGTMHAALADAAPPLSPNVATLETVMIIEGGAFPEDDPGFSLLYIGMGQTFSASRYFLLPSAEPSRLGDDAATLAASAPARADDPARLLAVIEAAPRRGAAALGFVSLDPGSGQLAAFLFGSHGCYRPAAINHSWLTLARRQATIVTIARSGVPSAPPPIFGDADSAEPSYHGFSSLANGLVSPALHALLASLSSPGTPAASPGSDLLSIWRYSPLEAYVQPVSPSQLLLTGHSDGTVCFWDISNKDNIQLLHQIQLPAVRQRPEGSATEASGAPAGAGDGPSPAAVSAAAGVKGFGTISSPRSGQRASIGPNAGAAFATVGGPGSPPPASGMGPRSSSDSSAILPGPGGFATRPTTRRSGTSDSLGAEVPAPLASGQTRSTSAPASGASAHHPGVTVVPGPGGPAPSGTGAAGAGSTAPAPMAVAYMVPSQAPKALGLLAGPATNTGPDPSQQLAASSLAFDPRTGLLVVVCGSQSTVLVYRLFLSSMPESPDRACQRLFRLSERHRPLDASLAEQSASRSPGPGAMPGCLPTGSPVCLSPPTVASPNGFYLVRCLRRPSAGPITAQSVLSASSLADLVIDSAARGGSTGATSRLHFAGASVVCPSQPLVDPRSPDPAVDTGVRAYLPDLYPEDSVLLALGDSSGGVTVIDLNRADVLMSRTLSRSEGSRIVTLPINHVSFVPTASAALSVAYRAINDLTPGGGPGSTVTSPPMSPSHAATVGAAATAAAQQQQQQQQQRPASTSHAPGAGMLSRAMATLWVSSVEDPRPLRSAYRLFEKLSEPLFNDEGAATSRSLSELSVSFGGTQRSFSRAFVHRILEFTPVSSLSVPGAERLSPPTSPTPVGAAGPGGGAHASPAAGGAQPGPGGPVTPRAPPPVALSGDVAALVFVGSLLVASRPDAVAPQSQFTPDRFLAPVVGPAVPPNSTVSTLPVSILRRFCDDPAPGSPYMPDGRQITVCVSTTHVRVLLGQPVAGGSGLSGGLSLDALLRRTGHFPADADFACLSADALPGRAPGAEKLTFLRADILQVPLVTALAGGTPIPRSRFPSAAEVAAMHAASGAVPAAPATAAEAPPPGGSRPGALACPPLSLESGYCLAVLTSDGGLYLLALPSLHVMYIMPTGPLFVDRAWRLGLAAFLSGPMPSDLGVCLFEGHGQLGFTPLFGDYEEDDHAGVGFGPGGVPAEPHQQHSVFDAARVHFLRGCALSAGDKFGDGVPQLAQTQSLFSNLLSRLHNYGDDDIINLIAPPSSRPASRSPSHGSGLGASGRGQTPAEKRAALLQGSSVPPPSNARQPEDPATVQVSAGAAGAAAAAHRAKLALDERGQRLQDAQLKTEELADESRNFADSSKNLRKLMEKKRFLF